MWLTNNPEKIKHLVGSGVAGVVNFAKDYTLFELEIALEYAETLPLAHASKSMRKQLGIEIRRKKKAIKFVSAADQVEAAVKNAQYVIKKFKESFGE